MYLLCFEDNTKLLKATVSKDELDAADAGLLDVIDISVPGQAKEYFGGEWAELPVHDE